VIDVAIIDPGRMREFVAGIDRSEIVERNYRVVAGALVAERSSTSAAAANLRIRLIRCCWRRNPTTSTW
jgi:hypothetical protein